MMDSSFAVVQSRIQSACEKFHNSHVDLLAVSKKKSLEDLLRLYHLGQRAFGESYLQEAIEKIDGLSEFDDIEWHFIGHVQSNKTKIIAEKFAWVQAVDSEKIAKRLSDQRPTYLPDLNILIQVNISDDSAKFGVNPKELKSLVEEISVLPKLNLRGLMVLPEKLEDFAAQAACFSKAKSLYAEYTKFSFDTLSMGMSADLEAAIANGSTMVRVGTALFGVRD